MSDTPKNWISETLKLPEMETIPGSRTVLTPSVILEQLGVEDLPEGTLCLESLRREAPNLAAKRDALIEEKTTVPSTGKGDEAATSSATSSMGRFLLLEEIGRGGMGRVLAAWDPELGRTVAIKVIADQVRGSQELLQRFVTEAKVTAQLEHPNIVPVYDMGISEQGEVYFAMRRVRGESLGMILGRLKDGDAESCEHWTQHRLLHAFIQVCNALGFAHDLGVLHRDIKPGNIMLGDFGEVLLLDWGLARFIDSDSDARSSMSVSTIEPASTMVGAVMGSPGYMSPEQAQGLNGLMDARSDVWALGAVLYEMLTHQRAYEGRSPSELLNATRDGPPTDPRARAPLNGISDAIAEVCLRAMSPSPGDRYATASELGEAVEAYLAGSQRREAALRRGAEAERAWNDFVLYSERAKQAKKDLRILEEETQPWLPLCEKTALVDARREVRDLGRRQARSFSDTIAGCEQALSQDPTNSEAHRLLAIASFKRMEEAEVLGDEVDRVLYRDRVLRHGSQEMKASLRAQGTVSLQTDPPGAEVICERFDTDELPWALVEKHTLGSTPLVDVPLDAGSYRFTLKAPGKRDTSYPIMLERGGHWDSGSAPVPLYSDDEIGDAWVYVDPGPFIYGGDPTVSDAVQLRRPFVPGFFISRLQVTMQSYCDFINTIVGDDPDQAWNRVPRQASELKDGSGQYWQRPEPGQPYVVPKVDRDGDSWDPQWPASAISWFDCVRYSEWYSEQLGMPTYLPTEQQWEKAARGVDGRMFPWGNEWDASLAATRHSKPLRPEPSVVGSVATDCSIYGMYDCAGSSSDWCGDTSYQGDSGRRAIRGGHWLSSDSSSRVTRRHGVYPSRVITTQSFRLARDAPFRS